MSEITLGLKVSAATKRRIEEAAEGISQAAVVESMLAPLGERDCRTLFGVNPERYTLALSAWVNQLARATHEAAQVLTRAEWNYLADACNGLMVDPGVSNPDVFLWAEASDAHKLNRLGDKWFPAGKKADAAVASLVTRLQQLTYAHAWAVIAAIQWFWDHCAADVDHQRDEWWSLPFRRRMGEKE